MTPPATCRPVGGLNSLGRRALPHASRTCGHWDLQPLRRSRVVGQEALPRCFVERCSVPGVEVVRQVSELRFDALREAQLAWSGIVGSRACDLQQFVKASRVVAGVSNSSIVASLW